MWVVDMENLILCEMSTYVISEYETLFCFEASSLLHHKIQFTFNECTV